MATGRLESLLDDLFSLEVNTIIKHGMTATKMPNAAHALLDLAIDYGLAVNRIGAEKDDLPAVVEHKGKKETFDQLRERASRLARTIQGLPADRDAAAIAGKPERLTDEQAKDLLMLCRIRDTSDLLKGLVPEGTRYDRSGADATELTLTDKQRLVLRKAWELSTEEVVMQTVIYLDGDVITRLRPDCATPEQRPLVDVHQKAVDTSVAFWRGLVEVVRAIFGTLLNAKPPAGPP